MKNSIILIMIITILSKFFGLIRDIALTYFFGATSITDVYLISQTIPSSLFSIIGAGLATSFIPLYNRIQKNKGDETADRFTSNVINVVMLIITVIIIVVLIFTPQFISLYASGFKGEDLALAVSFTRISIVGMYFSGSIYLFNSYLQFYDPLKTAGYKTKTASYIEKNCSLNESMEKLRSNEHMEQSVIKTNNILDQCERTVAT